jgi:hypothetical protein
MLLDGSDMAKLKRVPRYERPAQSGMKHAETVVARRDLPRFPYV